MISAPQQNGSQITRQATRFVVLFGPDDGSRPSLANEVNYLELLSVQTSAGAKRVDAIKVRYNLATAGTDIEDVAANLLGSNRILEVRSTDKKGNFTRVLGWGKLEATSIEISDDTQSATLVARLDPFLFGNPYEFFPFWDAANNTFGAVDDDLVFNPLIDELVYGNMSSKTDATGNYNYFLDPESMRTTNAAQQHPGETIGFWDLASAVFFLCQYLNENEIYITNPQLKDLQNVFASFDADQFRNMKVPIGTYLPDALDLLLTPYGFGWYLDNSTDSNDPNGEATSTIRCFQRGVGTKMNVYQDPDGEAITIAGTNVNQFLCEYSLSQCYNEIDCASDRELVESTFTLVPGWDPSLDGYLDDSQFFTALAKEQLNATTYDVGRKWVVNESGDYNNRAGVSVPTLPFSGSYRVKRRHLEKCLSTDESFESFGYWVQGTDPEFDGQGTVRLAGFSVLQKEMGIYFEGDLPPYNLCQKVLKQIAPGYLTVTASVRGDARRWATADRQTTSPQGATVILALDLKDKFHFKQNAGAGKNQVFPANQAIVSQQGPNGKPVSDLVDPNSDGTLLNYAETLRDWQDVALLSTSVVLDGADHAEYKIGQTVKSVAGRDIALNSRNPANPGDDPRHPQIMGINYVFNARQQRQELVLESFRRETFPELVAKGEGPQAHVHAEVPHVKQNHPWFHAKH